VIYPVATRGSLVGGGKPTSELEPIFFE
jgi:hypothetical protein